MIKMMSAVLLAVALIGCGSSQAKPVGPIDQRKATADVVELRKKVQLYIPVAAYHDMEVLGDVIEVNKKTDKLKDQLLDGELDQKMLADAKAEMARIEEKLKIKPSK